MKARLIHRKDRGFYAEMTDEEMYNGVKSGKLHWDETQKSRITHYLVPASVFERLIELDKKNDAAVKEETDVPNNG